MQEYAPRVPVSGLASLGECPAQGCGKHSNVRLKMLIVISTHIHSRALFCLADKHWSHI
jgi:hypothetical protein